MLIVLKLRKIDLTLVVCLLACCLQAVATVPGLNQCPDMIFIDGNENSSIPSNGSGGAYPGSMQQTITGGHTYYYYIPSSYQPTEPMPLMAVWHGAAGAGNAAAAAEDMRDFWQGEAESNHFIVLAQASTGASGGWIPVDDSQTLAAIIDDMQARYNIETTRRYVWGFSAGGHVMHAIALNSADYFAAYAISAGILDAYATSSGYVPANAVRTIPAYISVGLTDTLLPYAQQDQFDFTQAGWEVGHDYWLDVFTGGHELLNDLPEKAWDKICIATNLD